MAKDFKKTLMGKDAVPAICPAAPQTLSFGQNSVRSAVISSSVVKLTTTKNVFFIFGNNQVNATAGTGFFLAEGESDYFTIEPGSFIAAIQDPDAVATGKLYITEWLKV